MHIETFFYYFMKKIIITIIHRLNPATRVYKVNLEYSICLVQLN